MAAKTKKKVKVFEKKKQTPEAEIIAKLQSKYEKVSITRNEKYILLFH